MSRLARGALHLALVTAIAALVVARGDRWLLILLVPLALAPGLRWRRAPRALVTLLPAVAGAALLALYVIAVVWRQIRFVGDGPGGASAYVLGWLLAVLAVVFILGHRIWPAPRTLLPVTVGLLVVSGLEVGVPLFVWFATPVALALWTFAFVHGGPRHLDRRLVVFALASAGVAAGTIRLLPWAQPHVERAAARAFAEATTGLSAESRLGEFGGLARSNRVVLRVWTSRPQLLRAYVYSRFDGRAWSSAAGQRSRRALLPAPPGSPVLEEAWLQGLPGGLFVISPTSPSPLSGRDLVETRVVQSAIEDWPLLVPTRPLLVRAPVPVLQQDGGGELRWSRFEPARLYGIVNEPRPGPETRREERGVLDAALTLPARVDPRLRIRARILSVGTRSDRGRLQRTVEWLRSEFTYSLDVGSFETADPLAEFLFEKKVGYCEYFATAAAVVLRLQGVPTRYVKGFSVGPHNFIGPHHRVRESDAHAWIEAFVEGEGWVEADPTPPEGFSRLHDGEPGGLDRIAEALRARLAELWARSRHEGFSALVRGVVNGLGTLVQSLGRRPLVVALVVLGLVTAVWWRRLPALVTRLRALRRTRAERAAALPPELRALLRATERHWSRRGRPRPPARGLREHLVALPPGALSAAGRETSARVVEVVYRSAFGGRDPSAEEIQELRRAVERLG